MNNLSKKGCAECEDFWQFSKVSRPYELKTNYERHSTLYRCSNCSAFWEESERYAVIISEQEVEKYYGKKYLENK